MHCVAPHTPPYTVAASGRKQIRFELTLLGVDKSNVVKKIRINSRYEVEYTDKTLGDYLYVCENRFSDVAVDMGLVLPTHYITWAVKVTAPDGSDSRVFADDFSEYRMSDYPLLFVDGCRIEIHTPLYHARCLEAKHVCMDNNGYMQIQYPPGRQ